MSCKGWMGSSRWDWKPHGYSRKHGFVELHLNFVRILHTLELRGMDLKKVWIIIGLMHRKEQGWLNPHVVFSAILLPEFLMEAIPPSLKRLSCIPHEPLTTSQLEALSMAAVSEYQKTLIVSHYHTLPRQSCANSPKASLPIWTKRYSHSLTCASTAYSLEMVPIQFIEPSLLFPTMVKMELPPPLIQQRVSKVVGAETVYCEHEKAV